MSAVSARKLAANRANATASTGPRTAAGKARSARNAVRHGLAGETRGDPATIRAIERLGRALAGNAIGEERSLAYRVAAAQVDLERVQQAQREVFADPRLGALLATGGIRSPQDATDAGESLELLEDCVYKLAAIQRYEDRAYGQRRRAIRQLDGLRSGEPPPVRRPRGFGLARWRMRPPSFRIIRFEGLPRWAWWRPDPLAEGRAAAASRQRDESGETNPRPLPTSPPLAGEGARSAGGGEKPPRPASIRAAAPAPAMTTQQLRETNPRRWGATAVPIPTCRIGPCRWVGELPADHWSTRGWRYKRPP